MSLTLTEPDPLDVCLLSQGHHSNSSIHRTQGSGFWDKEGTVVGYSVLLSILVSGQEGESIPRRTLSRLLGRSSSDPHPLAPE